MSTELLSLTDMRAYFPDARIAWSTSQVCVSR